LTFCFTILIVFQKIAAEKEALDEENYNLKHKLEASKTR